MGETCEEVAGIYYNISMLCEQMKNFEKALILAKKSIKIYETVLDTLNPKLGNSYKQVSDILTLTVSHENSLLYYENALNVFNKRPVENDLAIAMVYTNIGYLFEIKKQYDKSIELHENSNRILRNNINYGQQLGLSYFHLGHVNSLRGNYHLADSFYKKSIAYTKDINNQITTIIN